MAKLKLTEKSSEVEAPKPQAVSAPINDTLPPSKVYALTMQEVSPGKYNVVVAYGDDAELVENEVPWHVARGTLLAQSHKLAVACSERR